MAQTRSGRVRASWLSAVALGASAVLLPACKTGAPVDQGRGPGGPAGSSPTGTAVDRGSSAEARANVEQARSLKSEGRDDEALALLARAIETNPTLTVAHMEMGEILEAKQDLKSAERAFGRAAELEPTNFDAQFSWGRVLQKLERFAESIRAYLRALAIRPDDPEANQNLATAYLQINEPNQALAYATRSVALSPRSGPAYANLGAVYSALARHEDAIRAYESAAELMELDPALLLNLAESYGKTERFEQMNNTLESLLSSGATAAAHERHGYALFKLRRYADSEQAFRAALSMDADYFPALNGLGVCMLNRYINSGKEDRAAQDEAVALFRRSLRQNRNQPKIVELLGRFGG